MAEAPWLIKDSFFFKKKYYLSHTISTINKFHAFNTNYYPRPLWMCYLALWITIDNIGAPIGGLKQ